MSQLKNTTVVLLVACLTVALFAPAQAMPPAMLRTVCGVAADAGEVLETKALAAGKVAADIVMKPIAIVGGLKAAAVGTGMKAGGAAIKFVGAKMAKDGAILEASGMGVKGAGLGVAALAVKPHAEKIVAAGQVAQGSIDAASAAANKFAKAVGDTSVQIDATVDSPIIGHHHKNIAVTAGLDTAAHQLHGDQQQVEQQVQQVEQQVEQQSQQVESQTRSKRATKIDPDVLKAALNLVKEAKMEDCVARAICDLNCNPQGFGQDGKQVFMNMVKLQGTNIIDKSETKPFLDAANKGRQNSGKCDQCSVQFSDCKSKSTDLIKMASHIRMD